MEYIIYNKGVIRGVVIIFGYNIIDILNKAISIACTRRDIYTEISKQPNQPPVIKILSNVLANNAIKTLVYYDKLKKETNEALIETIDFDIYDKISFLISQFNLRMHSTDAKTPKEFICFSINYEKEILTLFLDIQGRLVKDTNDTTCSTYMILSDMIQSKTKLISDLESHN